MGCGLSSSKVEREEEELVVRRKRIQRQNSACKPSQIHEFDPNVESSRSDIDKNDDEAATELESTTAPFPLLSLPLELRLLVYEFALGRQRIHFRERKDFIIVAPEPRLWICLADTDDDNDKVVRDCGGACRILKGPLWKRHTECSSTKKSIQETLSLNLLLACRQIYHEARFVPFTSNTFIIHTPRQGFYAFRNIFYNPQIAALRSLVLEVDGYALPEIDEWGAKLMTGLRDLRVGIDVLADREGVLERVGVVFGVGRARLTAVEVEVCLARRERESMVDLEGLVGVVEGVRRRLLYGKS